MGVVYQVKAPSGALCALKTLARLSASLLFRLRCEIQSLSQMKHPGIVPILDHGVLDGSPWYVMPLLSGGSLLRYCETPPANEADLIQRLKIFSCISESLAFLHGEGFLHLDLKPENILLEGDTPILVDFGLAAALWRESGREALAVSGPTHGTPAYMSPEQIKKQSPDTRTDLYSLGCIFYSLLTGSPPFVGATLRSTLQAHLQQTPQPPSAKVPWLPEDLDQLSLSLLQKSPTDRLGYAADIVPILSRFGVSPRADWPHPRPYLYRPRLAGRSAPLALLLREVENLARQREQFFGSESIQPKKSAGGMFFIEGESGIGKTRLASEIASEASNRELSICAMECAPSHQAQALASLRPLLQHMADYCRSHGEEVTRDILGARSALFAIYEPSFVGLTQSAAPPELAPDAARLRLYVYLAESLSALSKEEPLLLLLDDLQWADPLTVGFLQHLLQTKALSSSPILWLCFYRSDEATTFTPPSSISLPRLSEDAVQQAVFDMLAVPPERELLTVLQRTAEGNPFFVSEYLRSAVEEGSLARVDGRWQFVGEIHEHPSGLLSLFERRFTSLGAEEQELLLGASVLGREFSSRRLSALFGDSVVFSSLHTLSQKNMLTTEEDKERLRFSHELLRRVAYQRLPAERRVILHRRSAEILSTEQPIPYGEVAYHWREADDTTRAKESYLFAAREALQQYALEIAAQMYQECIALIVDAPERLRIQLEYAHKVLFMQGKSADAHKLLQEIEASSRETDGVTDTLRADVFEALGDVLRAQSKLAAAQEMYRRSLEVHQARNDASESRLCCALLPVLVDQGLIEEFHSYHQRATSLTKDPSTEAQLALHMARLCWVQGNMDEASRLYQRVINIQQERGDRVAEGIATANFAGVSYMLGFVEQAEVFWRRALAIHREVGNKRNEGTSLGNLAGFLQEQGRAAEAEQCAKEALVIHQQTGSQRSFALLHERMATWQQERGEFEKAREGYQLALATLRENNDKTYQPYTLIKMATLERRVGAFSEASQYLQEAESILLVIRDVLGLLEVHCQRGYLALAMNQNLEEILAAIHALSIPEGAEAKSYFKKSLSALSEAHAAYLEKRPLFYGESLERLPPALRSMVSQP
jgi:serine/threonine protein kinase/tetratricopeptide (TPR) repeat protein